MCSPVSIITLMSSLSTPHFFTSLHVFTPSGCSSSTVHLFVKLQPRSYSLPLIRYSSSFTLLRTRSCITPISLHQSCSSFSSVTFIFCSLSHLTERLKTHSIFSSLAPFPRHSVHSLPSRLTNSPHLHHYNSPLIVTASFSLITLPRSFVPSHSLLLSIPFPFLSLLTTHLSLTYLFTHSYFFSFIPITCHLYPS